MLYDRGRGGLGGSVVYYYFGGLGRFRRTFRGWEELARDAKALRPAPRHFCPIAK
jgi:hypothetical protein